jgi:hypothetical protein
MNGQEIKFDFQQLLKGKRLSLDQISEALR